jgi:hypothetical protein
VAAGATDASTGSTLGDGPGTVGSGDAAADADGCAGVVAPTDAGKPPAQPESPAKASMRINAYGIFFSVGLLRAVLRQ